MCNVKTYSFPEGTGYGIGRMYPAVGVQNILKRKKLVGYAELGIGKKNCYMGITCEVYES